MRYELRGAIISDTKFTEMGWNDGVFEGSKEHLDVLGSAQVFQFMYVEKNLFYYKEILHFATLRSEWHGSVFYLRLGIWIIFETQRFFILIMFLREQSWRNSFAVKRGGKWYGMRCEVRGTSISITKFTKYRWNDCVFERTEEHRRCSGKCTGFQFMYVEKNLFYYKEILHFATLRSEWQSFG